MKIKVKVPEYYETFQCIGSACQDNCCIGWNVDIDQKTYQKYQGIQTQPLKSIVKKRLKVNPNCYDPEVNYAYVNLLKGKKCVFLDDHRLCRVQKEYGEDYLSNVCTSFPRIYNQIDACLEASLGAACPEALSLFLFNEEGIHFVERQVETRPPLMNYVVDTGDALYKTSPVSQLVVIRDQSIEILKDRRLSFEDRMTLLGMYIEKLNAISYGSSGATKAIERRPKLENRRIKISNTRQLRGFYQWISQCLDAKHTVDNKRYLERFDRFKRGLESSEVTFQLAFDKVTAYFLERPYILENFFVNLAFKNLFPFTEAEGIFEAYVLFYIRLVMIYYELSGLVVHENELTDQMVLDYLQCLTKAIEHHDSFFIDCIEQLKKQNKCQLNDLLKLSED